MPPLLTIGLATYDDYDGVYFTIQALRMYQSVYSDQTEIIVIDNNPGSVHGKATKQLVQQIGGRYIPDTTTSSSFNKYKIVEHATGKYVLIVDCHVLLQPGAIDSLLEHYEQHPNCRDLIQGPLLHDDLITVSTHFAPGWSGHMWGTWSTNIEAYSTEKPFEIPMQGMGLLSFERSNWPGISKHFRGFGGEEGYISERFRQRGGTNICIPRLKWVHRFNRPNGVPFPLMLEDRIWNYFIGYLDLYKDAAHERVVDTYKYFAKHINEEKVKLILEDACKVSGIVYKPVH